jgi:hypothetical protein
MNTNNILAVSTCLVLSLFVSTGRGMDITATNSGNWSDTNIWNSGTVPGPNDDADVPLGITVTVDTNVTIQYIYDSGTVTMAANASLDLTADQAIDTATTLNATAPGNTVVYSGNPFFAKQCNYFNLIMANTNYVDAYPPYYPFQDFNNFSSAAGPTPMTIAGDMTLMGAIKVQQGSGGAPITIGGNLTIGTNCIWDCSGDDLTVVSNAYIYGLLEDLNGALGTNYIGGNVLVSGPGPSGFDPATGTGTNGWNVSDVITWGVGGNLTNNGAIYGVGYGSISFTGTGIIAGTNALTLPTMAITGTYTIGDTITMLTNTPTLDGTLVFDLAIPGEIILDTYPTNPLTLYFNGNLDVIDSGAPPVSGTVYQFFSAMSYGGTFANTTLPTLSGGMSWVNNLATSGSIMVTGGVVGGKPAITPSMSGGQLTLSWNSTTYPGYSVQAQTNQAGLGSSWSATPSGTVSPFVVTINPTNPPVFYRLMHP